MGDPGPDVTWRLDRRKERGGGEERAKGEIYGNDCGGDARSKVPSNAEERKNV